MHSKEALEKNMSLAKIDAGVQSGREKHVSVEPRGRLNMVCFAQYKIQKYVHLFHVFQDILGFSTGAKSPGPFAA